MTRDIFLVHQVTPRVLRDKESRDNENDKDNYLSPEWFNHQPHDVILGG